MAEENLSALPLPPFCLFLSWNRIAILEGAGSFATPLSWCNCIDLLRSSTWCCAVLLRTFEPLIHNGTHPSLQSKRLAAAFNFSRVLCFTCFI